MTFNWWQTMVFAILLFAGGFFTRQWTTPPPPPPQIVHETHIDTVETESPPVTGSTTVAVNGKPGSMQPGTVPQQRPEKPLDMMPGASLYEAEVDTIQDGTHINIRATSYVVNKDSAFVTLEWNVQPRPIQTVTKTDTVFVMHTVEVPAKPAFFEKPTVAYTIGYILGVGTVIAIDKLLSK